MGDIFNDPDGDALTYKAESSHNTIATVYVSGSTAGWAVFTRDVKGSHQLE